MEVRTSVRTFGRCREAEREAAGDYLVCRRVLVIVKAGWAVDDVVEPDCIDVDHLIGGDDAVKVQVCSPSFWR